MHWDTAALATLIGALAGWLVPALIARLPEPAPDVAAHEADAAVDDVEADEDRAVAAVAVAPTAADSWPEKTPYAALAAAPGLARKCAVASGIAAGLVGLEIGWSWPLAWLVYLCPVGVALAYIDFRVWLLPTRIIAPSYAVVGALLLIATAVTGDLDALKRSALGWLIAGAVFWVLWRFTPGMGYGDVRLSGVLGLALGWLGWGELLTGVYAGFLVGTLGWIPLRLLRVTRSRKFPFGPFMLVGALVGVLWGAEVGDYLAARS